MKKRKLISTGIQFGNRGPDLQAVRDLAKADPAGFMRKVGELVEAGAITLQSMTRMDALHAALADVQVPVTMQFGNAGERTVTASAFPILTGTAIVAAINARYEEVPTIAAVHMLDKNVEEVKETDDFPEIGAAEESVEIRHKRNGRKLTISAETIEENEVADIVERVNGIAEIASDHVEEQTLKRVTDYDGSKSSPAEPYVYRPNGTGTAIFSASANTPGTRAPSGTRINSNALEDETDLDAARTRLAAMKNNRGTRIAVPQSEVQILVPDALVGTAAKILNSEYVPGVENEVSNWGPRGRWGIPPDRCISSPKLDDLSASAWYYGAFKRQYRRKWKLRMEYVTLGMDTQAYLNSRIAFQARIAWDCEIGAVDYVFVIQNLNGTTAPADE